MFFRRVLTKLLGAPLSIRYYLDYCAPKEEDGLFFALCLDAGLVVFIIKNVIQSTVL